MPNDRPARGHSIERTSPKGPGQTFIGTCRLCGRTGLTWADMDTPCENVRGLTEDAALLEAIDPTRGPAPETGGQFLQRIGTDASKWAEEFKLSWGGSMDEGWLIGWFANAIEAGRTAGRASAETALAEARSALTKIEARVYGSAVNLGSDIVNLARAAVEQKL